MEQEPTVFLVDDDVASSTSICWLIESVNLPIKHYQNAKDFLEDYTEGMRGCLVTDVRMPGMSGLQLQEALKHRNIQLPIIFITGYGDVPMAVRAMKSGAFDFLTKPFDSQMLLESINDAIAYDAGHCKKYHEVDAIKHRIDTLSPREHEVMALVVKGYLNKQIAAELSIATKTVELHRAKIMEKMQARSLAHLVTMVMLVEHTSTKEENLLL